MNHVCWQAFLSAIYSHLIENAQFVTYYVFTIFSNVLGLEKIAYVVRHKLWIRCFTKQNIQTWNLNEEALGNAAIYWYLFYSFIVII